VNLTNSTNRLLINRNILGIAGAFITLAIPFFIGHADPHIETAQSLCPFKMVTGFPCPGCGITKALIFLYQGEIVKSLHYHLFAIPLVLFCVTIIVLLTVNLFKQKLYFRNWIYNKKLAYGLAITLITYHGIRLVYFVTENNIHDILEQSIWK
jgi:hypothetical protein